MEKNIAKTLPLWSTSEKLLVLLKELQFDCKVEGETIVYYQTNRKIVAYIFMYVCAELSVHLLRGVGQYECVWWK